MTQHKSAHDHIGYIVNEKEYGHGGYEVDSRSYYGPGLGAFIATHAAETAAEATRMSLAEPR